MSVFAAVDMPSLTYFHMIMVEHRYDPDISNQYPLKKP